MPRVSERYATARREQVLQAARRCFVRHGFQATSMQQICAESKLSPGAVYGYFASKEDLVMAIAEQVLARIVPELDVRTTTRDLPPLSEVLGRLTAVLDEGDGDLARLAVQVWAEALRNPALATRLAKAYQAQTARLAKLVSAYQRCGKLAAGTPARAIASVLTMLGPAFLLHRALTDTPSEAFSIGLRGLVDSE
jgi:AcrR family transcriptional regulator